jgi:U3 small nucleolar RNA-associated protein 15
MASNEYRAVELKRFAKTSSDTAEARAWRSFKSSILPHGTHAIHSLSFAPFSPFHLAVPNGMRVTMYDTSSHSSSSSGQPAFTVHKNISRFHHPVSATAYRRDASLLACASSEGKIQVFDLSSRIVLRTFRGHNTDVKCVFFTHDMESVVSCSDDHTARVWDIPGNTQRGIFKGHTDYVRCGLELQGRANTLVTGSYDHTVKLWDMRTQQCTLTLDHGEPVMAVVAAASGSLVYSAGGNYIRVWDILSGGKCVAVLNNHSQEITSLCINEKTNRLFR